jgi:hypothetical protein
MVAHRADDVLKVSMPGNKLDWLADIQARRTP